MPSAQSYRRQAAGHMVDAVDVRRVERNRPRPDLWRLHRTQHRFGNDAHEFFLRDFLGSVEHADPRHIKRIFHRNRHFFCGKSGFSSAIRNFGIPTTHAQHVDEKYRDRPERASQTPSRVATASSAAQSRRFRARQTTCRPPRATNRCKTRLHRLGKSQNRTNREAACGARVAVGWDRPATRLRRGVRRGYRRVRRRYTSLPSRHARDSTAHTPHENGIARMSRAFHVHRSCPLLNPFRSKAPRRDTTT